MLDNQTFTSGFHDVVHFLSDIFGRLSFIFCYKLDATLNFFETLPHILFAERGGTVGQRLAVKVQKIKNSDYRMSETVINMDIVIPTTWSGVMLGLGLVYGVSTLISLMLTIK